jgi:hypothetical protein
VVLLGYGRKSFEINAHVFNNASNPPFTRLSSDNFILSVPDGAQMEAATVSAPDGGTTKLALFPIPGQSGKYRIDFPMKPGLTKYAINYQVPYDGKLVFNRRAQYPMKQIGIILPASMHFRRLAGNCFMQTWASRVLMSRYWITLAWMNRSHSKFQARVSWLTISAH